MGQQGEQWREHRDYLRRQKGDAIAARSGTIQRDVRRIEKLGYSVRQMKNKDHWRIEGYAVTLDWWPNSDLWRDPRTQEASRWGFREFLTHLRKVRDETMEPKTIADYKAICGGGSSYLEDD